MPTASSATPLGPPPSSSSSQVPILPIECIELILDSLLLSYPYSSNSNLYRCALVSTTFRDLSLSRLYRNLHLYFVKPDKYVRKDLWIKIAKSEAFRRYRVKKSLRFEDVADWTGWEGVLEGCDGVERLEIVRGSSDAVPEEFLQHRNLAGLKELNLSQHLVPTNAPLAIPFRLHKITTNNHTSQDHYLKCIIAASLQTLSSVTFTDTPRSLSLFHPLASSGTLKHLELPPYFYVNEPLPQLEISSRSESRLEDVEKLLNVAVGLEHLTIVADYTTNVDSVAEYVRMVLKETKSELKVLELRISKSGYTELMWEVIEDSLERVSMRKLKMFECMKVPMVELEKIEGWGDLRGRMDRMGVQVVAGRR